VSKAIQQVWVHSSVHAAVVLTHTCCRCRLCRCRCLLACLLQPSKREYKIKNLETECSKIAAKEKTEGGLTQGQASTLVRLMWHLALMLLLADFEVPVGVEQVHCQALTLVTRVESSCALLCFSSPSAQSTVCSLLGASCAC
jgi:hypothetical protein